MKKILRERAGGKTTELINLSAEKGFPILCMNENTKIRIKEIASKYNLTIPEPLTFHNFEKESRGRNIQALLVDDADLLLQRLLQIPIYALSMSIPTKMTKAYIAMKLGLDPENMEIID